MKLRNKKTGEICELFGIMRKGLRTFLQFNDSRGNFKFECDSIAELNEEWEDVPEELPEGYWVVEPYGKAEYIKINKHWSIPLYKQFKDFGNCFETKEEAEQAVEKLRAWKRLRDKGFRFECYMRRSGWVGLPVVKALENLIDITAYLPKDKIKEMEADLDLIFGGKDEC